MNEFVEDYDFLDEKECKILRKMVQLFEKNGRLLFGSTYSLGNPSYTHRDRDVYFETLPEQRELLLKNFSDFHKKLFTKLESILGLPIKMTDDLSPPGFHIFNMGDKNAYHMHLDNQYILFKGLKEVEPTRDNVLTFTILLNTTPMKTGIEYYPKLVKDKAAMVFEDLPKYLDENFQGVKLERIEYEFGRIYLHRGLIPHRLYYDGYAPVKRITVQGHLIKYQGEYIAYW